MLPINFPGTNCDMGRPSNMTAEECGDLRVRHKIGARGPMFTSCWRPSAEDITLFEMGKALVVEMRMNASIFVDIDTRLMDEPQLFAANRILVWLPSALQMVHIKNGGGIYITFLTERFPVMSVYVNPH